MLNVLNAAAQLFEGWLKLVVTECVSQEASSLALCLTTRAAEQQPAASCCSSPPPWWVHVVPFWTRVVKQGNAQHELIWISCNVQCKKLINLHLSVETIMINSVSSGRQRPAVNFKLASFAKIKMCFFYLQLFLYNYIGQRSFATTIGENAWHYLTTFALWLTAATQLAHSLHKALHQGLGANKALVSSSTLMSFLEFHLNEFPHAWFLFRIQWCCSFAAAWWTDRTLSSPPPYLPTW